MTHGRYRWALAVVAVSAFMITMDNTVVANALPTIMADLHMSATAKDWVATGYILMFSCLMIAGGRLTDVYGCRITFVSGMTVFTAASAACGLAPDATVLVLARVAQGAGAALALPATQVMVTVGRSDKQRSLGMIVWVGAGSAATALGPTIGGLIVQHWHWGWIFLINIVPGVLVILLGLVVLTGHGENADARVDLPGVLISATLLFAFTYGLEEGRTIGWTDPSVLSVFALVLIALVCFVAVESWAPDPMIDLRFFRNRVFTGGLLSQMLYGIGFNGMIFYSATFLQRYLGFTPPEAGLVMLPPSIAIMVLTPVGFWLAAKAGPRGAIGGGMALMAFGMFLFATLRRGDGYAELMPGVMIVGAGAALAMPLVMYVLKAIPEHQAGVASGIINVIREASGAFGIAIVGLLVHEVPEPGASAESLETFRQGTASGLIVGAAAVLIGGVICALTLPSKRGWLGPKHGKHSTPVEAAPAPEPALAAPVPATRQASAHRADTAGAAHPHAPLTRHRAAPPAAQPHAPAPRRPAPPEHLPPPHRVAPRVSPRYGQRRHTNPIGDAMPPSPPESGHPWGTPPNAVPTHGQLPDDTGPTQDVTRAANALPPGDVPPPTDTAHAHRPLPGDAEAPQDVTRTPTGGGQLQQTQPPSDAAPHPTKTAPPHDMPTHGAPPSNTAPTRAIAPTHDAMPPGNTPWDTPPPTQTPPPNAAHAHRPLPGDAGASQDVTRTRDAQPPTGGSPLQQTPAPSDAAPRPTETAPPHDAPTHGAPPDAAHAHGPLPGDAGARGREAMPPTGGGPHRDDLPPGGAPRSETAASGEATSRSPFPPPPEGWYHPYIPEDDTDPWGEWEAPRRGDAW
ncbi:hypothetical protein Acsp04_39410 [Actinomadura sp. NBRC 104425]|uniref:MFS transporter n=1 Tax=Actinomadura sp. NBRC 104425 TaxID=3032204 RepID=UPI0024A34C61|nr:MDR family MFS transporter [Actinomadura sp. NBRC 104425]GLZ13706.1 hypothetical protein Acsp04_39410 [Actinomadura sp. NBRC 104425]